MMVKDLRARFVRIICKRCGLGKVVFGKASSRVKCDSCNKLLLKTGGGKTIIKTYIKEVL